MTFSHWHWSAFVILTIFFFSWFNKKKKIGCYHLYTQNNNLLCVSYEILWCFVKINIPFSIRFRWGLVASEQPVACEPHLCHTHYSASSTLHTSQREAAVQAAVKATWLTPIPLCCHPPNSWDHPQAPLDWMELLAGFTQLSAREKRALKTPSERVTVCFHHCIPPASEPCMHQKQGCSQEHKHRVILKGNWDSPILLYSSHKIPNVKQINYLKAKQFLHKTF